MSAFPENDVELLHEYVSEDLRVVMDGVKAALPSGIISVRGAIAGPNADLVQRVLAHRRALLGFLEAWNGTIDLLQAISTNFQNREFGIVLTKIGELATSPAVQGGTIGDALRTQSLSFREQFSNEAGGTFSIPRTLPGYGGPVPTPAQVTKFLAFGRFMARDAERRFRERILEAEALVGQRRFDSALAAYGVILANTAGLGADRVKFVAVRAALAHLARGDELYASRQLAPEDRANVAAHYRAAPELVNAHGVSPANPLRQHIEAYATAQLAQLEAGFNALGFRDSYVPILRADFLLQRALERVAAATSAATKMLQFRQEANRLDRQEAELRLQEDVAAISSEIAAERIGIAQQQVQVTDNRVSDITGSLDSLLRNTALSGTGAIVAAVAGAAFGGAGTGAAVIQSVNGVVSSVLGYSSRQNELENQLEVLRIERAIAEREERIAQLEQRLAETRRQFFQEQLDLLQAATLNANLFYALARLYEDLADRSLAVAIRWAYLYERAVAFKRLKPNLRIIELDYRKSIPGVDTVVPAPDLLSEHLTDVTEQDVPGGPAQLLEENPISLRERYPLEFTRFLTTGSMEFVISLYDLDKRRPGVFERRLVDVKVQLVGLVPVTGFSGRIIHHGVFTLRDKDSTLTASRLLPTKEQMAAALADLAAGKTQGDPIEGVIPFLLTDERKELSAAPTPNDPNPEPAALALFEGYGETGQWTLEIDGVDLRLVSDVLITFRIVFPESDAPLQAQVEKLTQAYEEELGAGEGLDKMAAFSIRQQFPDAFDDLLGASGSATFRLDDSDFPPDIIDLRVKAVIAQVVDADGRGVEGVTLETTASGLPFSISRTTGPEGFTESLDADIPAVPRDERVPVQGLWTLRLSDPPPAEAIADVRLFYLYEFRPG